MKTKQNLSVKKVHEFITLKDYYPHPLTAYDCPLNIFDGWVNELENRGFTAEGGRGIVTITLKGEIIYKSDYIFVP